MNDKPPAQPQPPALLCLAGGQAPADLSASVTALLALDEPLRDGLQALLLPLLGMAPDDQIDQRIVELCQKLDKTIEALGNPLKGTRFLLRMASARDLSGEQLCEDLRRLFMHREGEADAQRYSQLEGMLLPIYDKARPALRQEIALEALGAHGKVLSEIKWRVDHLASSDMGQAINMPVALLTLHYQEGNKTDHITLQLLPQTIQQLRAVCDQLLG